MDFRNKLHYENRLARLMIHPVENAKLIRKIRRRLQNMSE